MGQRMEAGGTGKGVEGAAGGPHLWACRLRPASGSRLHVPSAPPGAGGGAQALLLGVAASFPPVPQHKPGRLTWGCVCGGGG